MMQNLKVLFVDDEARIRESMRRVINWQGVGCLAPVMAESAAKALELMETYSFDLVITDIVMQKMNGVELAKRIRGKWPDTRVIILSAYEDFAMARGAIEAGVVQYLLKPIIPSELESAILLATEQIAAREKQRIEIIESEKMVDMCRPVIEAGLWRELLLPSPTDDARLAGMMRLSGLSGIEDSVACILIHCAQVKPDEVHRLASNVLSSLLGWLTIDEESCVLISTEQLSAEAKDKLQKAIGACPGADPLIVCGNTVNDISKLRHSFEDARRKLAFYQAMRPDVMRTQYEVEKNIVNDAALEQLLTGIRLGVQYRGQNLRRQLEAYYQHLETQYRHSEARSLWEGRLLFELYQLAGQTGPEGLSYQTFFDSYERQSEPKQQIAWLLQWLDAYAGEGSGAGNAPRLLVENIKKYIHESFSDTSLSVKSIANLFYISNAYLSRIFRKYTGKTCIEFIAEERLRFAKSLLENTDILISSIAEKAGYSSIYYFSIQFKKMTGETPGEYRRKMQCDDDNKTDPDH